MEPKPRSILRGQPLIRWELDLPAGSDLRGGAVGDEDFREDLTQEFGRLHTPDLRRRAAVEPAVGHMKSDGLLGRNFLKGVVGDAQNVILCGAGHNMRKILAHLGALLRLLLGDPGGSSRHSSPSSKLEHNPSAGAHGSLIAWTGLFRGD